MGNRRLVRGAGSGCAIQTILENGMQGCVGAGIDLDGTLASGLKAIAAKGLGQSKNAKTGTITLLGMAPFAHDDFNIDFGVGADLCGLPADAFRCPVCFEAVMGRHMIFMGGVLAIAG